MELEFDVKITANVLYDYMLRHTYYSASGLIGTIVGALMIVYFFYRGGIIFLDRWLGDIGLSALDSIHKVETANDEYSGVQRTPAL